MRIVKTGRFLFFTAMISLLFSQSVSAYLDPAATSYIIQIISGVVIAGGVTVGIFWKKIRLFFRNMKMKSLENKLKKQGDKNTK